jgi:hypothetical protein
MSVPCKTRIGETGKKVNIRKRGEKMKLQIISLVISIIALVLAIAKAAG